jgi:hypothetical protein
MAAAVYRIDPSKAKSTVLGPQLLNAIEQINQAYAVLLTHRAAMIQQEDGSTGTDTDFVTPAGQWGFVDGNDSISSTVAHTAFTAIDSFVTGHGAGLQQMCAQFKQ